MTTTTENLRAPYGRCGRPRLDRRPCRNPVTTSGAVCHLHRRENLPAVYPSTVRRSIRDLLVNGYGAELASSANATDYYRVHPLPEEVPRARFSLEVTVLGPVSTLLTVDHLATDRPPEMQGRVWMAEHIAPYALDWARYTNKGTPFPTGGSVDYLYVLTPYAETVIRQWLDQERKWALAAHLSALQVEAAS